jgi:predicted phage tail protein
VPIGLDERFTFPEVPAGTYTFTVRATNAAGVGEASNPVTVTFPNGCTGAPQPPEQFLAYNTGNALNLMWNPPSAGPAATSYLLSATGAVVGTLPTTERTLSGGVGPGSYTLTVTAVNACGASTPTAPQTVVIP